MSTTLAVALKLVVSHEYTDAVDLSTPVDEMILDLTDSLANGTGADQANAVWHDRRTLAATSETLDLMVLTDSLGNALAFTALKGIIIHNRATTTAYDLKVGGAASNAWAAFVADSTDIANVMPNGILAWWSPTDAEAVDATHKSLKVDSGANSVTYDIWIVGTKA